MAQISAQFATGELVNMHSSNPEPFTWTELNDLIDVDLSSSLAETPLGYESTQGNPKLRSMLSQHNYTFISAEQLVLTSGAQEGIYLLMNSLLEAGDEVITFTPCFEPLVEVAKQAGAQVTLLSLDAENGWQINWQQLENSISHQTKLMVINFPHNPTGAHISATELKRIIEMCRKYDCWLLSDEVFRGLEHDSTDRLPTAADCYEKAISLGVVSKSLALPGIRMGWMALQDNNLLQKIRTVKSYLSICQSSLDAKICQQIIPHSEMIWQRNRKIIKENKQLVEQNLTNHIQLFWQPPKAAATGFIQFKTNKSSRELALSWANKHHLSVMPNEAFLTSNAGFRLTLGLKNAKDQYQQIMRSAG